jgi:hypothetical protein
MTKIKFREYVVKRGHMPLEVWKNENGYFAKIRAWMPTSPRGFTQVLQGGTLLWLSLKDSSNPNIVGNGVDVIFESAGKEAMGIAAFIGTRGDVVQKFIDAHRINARKLFNYVKRGNLKDRMDFANAILSKDGNHIQRKVIKMFAESANGGKKIYIDFLNKKKGFKQDRIKFNSYQDAVKWAKKNLEKFNHDMIKYDWTKHDEIDEITGTGAVAGFQTPNAFKKTIGTDVYNEPDGEYIDRLNKSTGYRRVNENRWLQLKKDESTPRVKLARGMSNIKKQLSEIETFLNWYSKIKNESGLKKEDYWKRTNKNLYRIKERLHNISNKIMYL